jgi:hypothetical protein
MVFSGWNAPGTLAKLLNGMKLRFANEQAPQGKKV